MLLVSHSSKLSHGRPSFWSSLVMLAALPAVAACSAGDDGGPGARVGADENEGPGFFDPLPGTGDGSGGGVTPSGQGGTNGLVETPVPGSGQIDIDDACVVDQAQAELVEQPVDIILLLDNSGSMSDELEAVEANINQNFATILANSGVDYRVILISRHRREVRAESGESSTSICVSTPLSNLLDCTAAPQPIFSDRFFQYSTKLESTDSFDVMLDTYLPPFDGSDREEKFDQAPLGWSAWLRPGAKKVFLELTDDNEDMPVQTLLQQLSTMAPEHFGTAEAPTFVFHSIIGIAEKANPTEPYLPAEPIQSLECTGNANSVDNAGETYQELSRLTGGLRFPLCQFTAYDVVFQTIAQDVVLTSNIACDFPIPQPPAGLELDLAKVAIQYTPGNGGQPVQFGQAPAFGVCQSNAFYIANGRATLCPDACAAIRSDPGAAVAVLFTCESTIIIQ